MITVIIKTRDDEMALAYALSALVPAAIEGIVREVVVIDHGSRDGTLTVADAAGCTMINASDIEGDARKFASERARADWIMFLSPSSMLESGWHSEALAFIDRAILAGEGGTRAAAFRLGLMEPGWRARLTEWAARLRYALLAAPHDEQGLLISRSFYRSIGGHRPLAAVADVDLARRIGRSRLTLLRSHVMISEVAERPGGFTRALRDVVCLTLLALKVSPRLVARLAD
jgi:glycosyltransferase involved in cell wall biosynthesis